MEKSESVTVATAGDSQAMEGLMINAAFFRVIRNGKVRVVWGVRGTCCVGCERYVLFGV